MIVHGTLFTGTCSDWFKVNDHLCLHGITGLTMGLTESVNPVQGGFNQSGGYWIPISFT